MTVLLGEARVQSANEQLSKTREALGNVEHILVAARDLQPGENLRPEDIRAAAWPGTAVPEDAFRTLGDLFSSRPDASHFVSSSILAGQPILPNVPAGLGDDGLASSLDPGMRAFSIWVDVASGVSGFLRPGDTVDIYWTGTLSGIRNLTRLIETNIKIIAISDQGDGDIYSTSTPRVVTVSVSQEQVAALAQAQSAGCLSLSLVGAQDETEVASIEATEIEVGRRELLGIEGEPSASNTEVLSEITCTVRTRRGTEVIQIYIPCPTNGPALRSKEDPPNPDGSRRSLNSVNEQRGSNFEAQPSTRTPVPALPPAERGAAEDGATVSALESDLPIDVSSPFVNTRLADSLENFHDGSIAYNAPEIMNFQAWKTIQLALVPSGTDELVAELVSPDLDGEVISVDLPSSLTKLMSAELQGAAFEVTPPGQQARTILDDRPTVWTWEVRPLEFGSKKTLTLSLFAQVDGSGSTPPTQVETIVRTIEVNVSLSSRIMYFASSANSLLSVLTAACAAAAALLAWVASLKLGKSRK